MMCKVQKTEGEGHLWPKQKIWMNEKSMHSQNMGINIRNSCAWGKNEWSKDYFA